MNNNIYMTYTDIQSYLNNVISTQNKKASLFDAIFNLYKNGKFSYSSNSSAIFPSQVKTKNELFTYFKNITSIDVTPIINRPNQLYNNVSEDYFMFHQRDARIMLQFQNELSYLHQHNYFEINFVLKGEMTLNLNDESHLLKEGGFVIISPNTTHQVIISNNSIVICIAIKKSTFDDVFFNLLKDDNLLSNFFNHNLYSTKRNVLTFYIKINHQILSTVTNIFIESYSELPQANEICSNYISILFSYALRNLIQTNNINSPNNDATNRMVTIINYIKKKSNTITLQELSQKFNYNSDYLGKLIKQSTGYTFNYLRNYYRIQKSCNLLKYTMDSIETIGAEVGYNSPNHFERCFKQYKKISPRKYRKSIIENN